LSLRHRKIVAHGRHHDGERAGEEVEGKFRRDAVNFCTFGAASDTLTARVNRYELDANDSFAMSAELDNEHLE
jgi:hypothetical protein